MCHCTKGTTSRCTLEYLCNDHLTKNWNGSQACGLGHTSGFLNTSLSYLIAVSVMRKIANCSQHKRSRIQAIRNLSNVLIISTFCRIDVMIVVISIVCSIIFICILVILFLLLSIQRFALPSQCRLCDLRCRPGRQLAGVRAAAAAVVGRCVPPGSRRRQRGSRQLFFLPARF